MKKPSLLQRFFATCPLGVLWLAAAMIAAMFLALEAVGFTVDHLRDWRTLTWTALAAPLVLAVGSFGGLILGSVVLGPIYAWREWVNGGPFRAGDRVLIIGGRHKGTITRVAGPWQGLSVRLELGKEAAEAFSDIYDTTQILRLDEPAEGAESDR